MANNPALVVPAFNRPASLSRLLDALAKAHYDVPPVLIISIDYSVDYTSVLQTLAQSFLWHGEKKVVVHQQNMGLKNHILWCASLSEQYGAVIVLEDDLMVSPWFYHYALSALEDTDGSEDVAGISLYAPSFNESAFLPFHPLMTGSGYYLMQLPCSWGQIWTREQYRGFAQWYQTDFRESDMDFLPDGIREWSAQSWKKIFILYLQQTRRFFAYPYTSFSQNMNEPGTHVRSCDKTFHNTLSLGFRPLGPFLPEQAPRYDASGNLLPDYLLAHCPALNDFRFEVDLYGKKLHNYDEDQWVLTCLPCESYVWSFALDLFPPEVNLMMGQEGIGLFLTRKRHIRSNSYPRELIRYFYPVPGWYGAYFAPPIREMLKSFFPRLLHKLFCRR